MIYLCDKQCVNLLTSATFFLVLKSIEKQSMQHYNNLKPFQPDNDQTVVNCVCAMFSAFHCRTAKNSLGKSLYLIPINNRKWYDDKKNSHQCCTKALFYLSKKSRVFLVWNPCVAVKAIMFVMMHSRCTRILQEKLWNPSKLWCMEKKLFHDLIIWRNI